MVDEYIAALSASVNDHRHDAGAVKLTPSQTRSLEAYADTVVPGCRRHADDIAISGVSGTPGAVEAGALHVLLDPAVGIADEVGEMADLLDARAQERYGLDVDSGFVELDYQQRRHLVIALTTEADDRDLWFLLALFCYMAYDSAPHRPTIEAVGDPTSGLSAMGFNGPRPNGRWGFSPAGYGKTLARLHPHTDNTGSLP